jgi:hypothetical protein
MRITRSVHTMAVLTVAVTVAACGTYGRGGMRNEPTAEYSATVVWDSGPIDQDYQHQRSDMNARHMQENSAPRDGESGDQRNQRQSSERKDLDSRYEQGKTSHAKSVPAGHDDRSH